MRIPRRAPAQRAYRHRNEHGRLDPPRAPPSCQAPDYLNACLRWAGKNEIVAKSPIANVERLPDGPGHATPRRRPLNDDDVARLLACIDQEDRELGRVAEIDGRTRIPQAPFLRFLLTLGTRYVETRLLAWNAVDFEQRTIVLARLDDEEPQAARAPTERPAGRDTAFTPSRTCPRARTCAASGGDGVPHRDWLPLVPAVEQHPAHS